jgi:hypothetical protein
VAYDAERRPGAFAKARESSHRRVALIFISLLCVATVLLFALLLAGLAGLVPALALLAVGYAAREFADPRLESGVRWGKGGNAEVAVGTALDSLRQEGYVVMHDLDRVVPGNVDHLVSGPSGVFMIETKFRRYENSDLPKARRVAKTVADDLGIRWVQPVICCAKRSYGPIADKGVAVVGLQQLLPYVRSQANPTAPFERLAAFADRQ